MSFETIPDTNLQYGLISYGADAKERPEQSGLMSQRLIDKAKADAVTDVFFFCHGWKGDEPAAKPANKPNIVSWLSPNPIPFAPLCSRG